MHRQAVLLAEVFALFGNGAEAFALDRVKEACVDSVLILLKARLSSLRSCWECAPAASDWDCGVWSASQCSSSLLLPGDPPTSSMFIILMVITAASTMQSVGGIDYLVNVARAILKKNPAYITLIAPLVAFVFTLGGTGFIYIP